MALVRLERETVDEVIATLMSTEQSVTRPQEATRQRQVALRSAGLASVAVLCLLPSSEGFAVPTPKTPSSNALRGTQLATLSGSRAASVSAAAVVGDDATVLSEGPVPRGLQAAARAQLAVIASAATAVAVVLRRRNRRQGVGRASTAPTLAEPSVAVPNMALTFSSETVDTAALFGAFMERSSGKSGKFLAGIPLPMAAVSGYTTVPLLAALAAVACPNPTVLARSLAAAMGSLFGSAAGGFLERGKQEAARRKVLRHLADHMQSPTALDELRGLVAGSRQQYGVDGQAGEAFEEGTLQDIYVALLNAVLDQPGLCAADLPTLQRLKDSLQLDDIVVGSAHKRAAQVLVSKGYSGLEEDELRNSVDKLLFLSQRVFSDIQPDEARFYEMSQLRKVLKISQAEAKSRIATVSQALYQEALTGVVDKVDAATAEVLAESSSTFGLGDEDTAQMNSETYQRIVGNIVERGSIDEGGWSTLAKAREVLQLGDRAATEAFNKVAGPLLRADVMTLTEQMNSGAKPSEAVASLTVKAFQVGLQADAADAVIVDGFVEACKAIYSEAGKGVRSAQLGGDSSNAIESLDQLMAFSVAVDEVLTEMRANEASLASKEPLSFPADGLAAGRLYALYLERELPGNAPASAPAASELARLFQLSAEDEETARVDVGQPHLEKVYLASIEKAAAGEVPLGMAKMAMEGELNKLNLQFQAVEESAMIVYKARLVSLGEKVISSEEKAQLDAERSFLDLSEADVRRLHYRAFGPTYEKSVDEAMGRGGIMRPEAKEALMQLASRLGLHPEDAENIFHGVAYERIRGYLPEVQGTWEEATYSPEALMQLYKDRKQVVGHDPSKDPSGSDMGFGAEVPVEGIRGYKFMVAATQVADFYVGNGIFKEGAIPGDESAYPVTLAKLLEETAKEEMYGIFAWNAVTTQDGLCKDKWGKAKPHVAGFLGLDVPTQKKVMERMVSRWANMFIKNQVKEQGKLSDQDVSTLTDWVPTFFGIEKEACQRLVKGANKGMLQSKVLKLLNQPNITPADVQSVRAECVLWDLRLEKDFELTKPNLRSLFRVEITASLEDPELSDDDKREAIEDAREAFGLEYQDALDELTDLLRSRCKGCLVNSVGDLMQGETSRAVKEMQRLELLSAFALVADGVDLNQDWEVAPAMRRKLVDNYASSAVAGKQANVALLEKVLGLESA